MTLSRLTLAAEIPAPFAGLAVAAFTLAGVLGAVAGLVS